LKNFVLFGIYIKKAYWERYLPQIKVKFFGGFEELFDNYNK